VWKEGKVEVKARRAAAYSRTDTPETLAIDIFRYLIDHEKVKLDIKERDKYPNIDGYLEIVDELRIPICKLEAQVKKLPEDGRKIQCPVALFSYSATACLPVLLIGVDTKRKKAYWVHITKELAAKSINGSNQKTKVIFFPGNNVLDGKDTRYIMEWKTIAETYQKKIRDYDKVKAAFEELSKASNPALGVDKRSFRDIHIFLDKLNALLDGRFSMVKEIFYPHAWKVGLAYYEYTDNSLSYSLYPTPYTRNDVQIKEIDAFLRKQLRSKGLGFTGHNVENPIKLRPREYAIDVAESKTLRVLENRLLNHDNEFLAREFIFAFIDRFSEQMGLVRKDSYSVDELRIAFSLHLRIWVDEAIKFMVKVQRNQVRSPTHLLYGMPYFDPEMLITQIMDDERKEIEHTVKKRIEQEDRVSVLPIGNRRFSFRIFSEFLSYLGSKGLQRIDRIYLPKDYSRLKGGRGWVWNVFSPDMVEANLKVFFDNLPNVYNDLVLQNFPEILEELPLFGESSHVVVSFSAKEECKAFRDRPTIEFFYLKTENGNNLQIEVFRKDEIREILDFSAIKLGEDIIIDGRKCKLISMSDGVLDFIYDDLTMFNFIYDILKENLKKYFNNLRAEF
jgi:hypothetical protein